MIKTNVAFSEGWLLSIQSEQSEKFSKSPDWLKKSRPSKIRTIWKVFKKPWLAEKKPALQKSHFCLDHV